MRNAWAPEPGRPTWGIVLGDVVRAAALVSLLVAAATADGVAVAVFALVLGGTMVPRASGAPAWLDVGCSAVVLAAAWCAVAGLYERVEGLDLLVHAVATGALAALAHQVLGRVGVAVSPVRPRATAALTVVGLGALLAVVWELFEAVGHAFVDDGIYVTYWDTVGDLGAALLGSAATAWLVARAPVGAPAPATAAPPAAPAARPLPSVSVVIPARDDAPALERCLELLAAQTLPPLEVVVVDNASRDRTAEVARRAGAVVVHEPRVGIPAAAARGYDTARGDVVARLDADSQPGADWVHAVARRLADDPAADAVTGTGTFTDMRGGRWACALYLGTYYASTRMALGHTSLWGSCMAMRRSTWWAVRDQVERIDPEVHDDLDLAFALGPRRRIVRDRHLRVGVSARSLRYARRRRWERAIRTLRLNWAVAPPWERWRVRLGVVARSSAVRG